MSMAQKKHVAGCEMKIVSEVVVLLVSDLQGFSSNHSDTSFIGKVSCRGCLFLNLIDFFPETSVKKNTLIPSGARHRHRIREELEYFASNRMGPVFQRPHVPCSLKGFFGLGLLHMDDRTTSTTSDDNSNKHQRR